jgi:RNA polymerase sigma-70 factor (ECF subfamily)
MNLVLTIAPSLASPLAGLFGALQAQRSVRSPFGRCDAERWTTDRVLRFSEGWMELGSEPAGERAGGSSALLAALRSGDESAFLLLVNRHQASMVRVAILYVGSRAAAEEVVQEAWLGVLKGLHLFEGRSSLKSWIFRILVNTAKARGIRESRSVPLSSLASTNEDEPAVAAERFQDQGVWTGHWSQPPSEWSDDRVASAELAAIAREAIERLPRSQREVMTLRDVEGWDAPDACELLQISEANQRVLLHRARSKVRAYMEERLGKEVRP